MKEKSCFKNKPGWRFECMTPELAQEIRLSEASGKGPFASAHQNSQVQALVFVEVEGGIVKEISLLNNFNEPIKVVLRDYDDLRDAPDEYQDVEWLLT